MKERPILFSAPMVRALLDGSKTQTRRAVKLPHQNPLGIWEATTFGGKGCKTATGIDTKEQAAIWHTRTGETLTCPKGKAGDQLYVRETWGLVEALNGAKRVIYKADGWKDPAGYFKWTPSIHMFRKLSRIQLEITNIRIERLNDCSEADAIAEGIERNWVGDLTKGSNGFGGEGWVPDCGWINYLNGEDGPEAYTPIESYKSLWESINGAGSWDKNPWVWVIEFKRIKP